MTSAKSKFDKNILEGATCLENFDLNSNIFALRYIWIVSVSSFDLYMTELVSEIGLRWIDQNPPVLTANLRQVHIPLENALQIDQLPPAEKLIFYRDHVYNSVRYTSFYKPEKVSEALSYIWICPAKEKWARITARMKALGRYQNRTERDIRDELTLIGDRRDLIAHSVDTPPGAETANPVIRDDAVRVIDFISDLALAIDQETEEQLTVAAFGL